LINYPDFNMENTVTCHYPCRQLAGRRWRSLNGSWRFVFNEERKFRQPSDISRWLLVILVPFPPDLKTHGIDEHGFNPACLYERAFHPKAESSHILMPAGFGGVACAEYPHEVKQTWDHSIAQNGEEFIRIYKGLIEVFTQTTLFRSFGHTQFTDPFPKANGMFIMDALPEDKALELQKIAVDIGSLQP
jgi:hypothetical protein